MCLLNVRDKGLTGSKVEKVCDLASYDFLGFVLRIGTVIVDFLSKVMVGS